jgi:hypothetical protein
MDTVARTESYALACSAIDNAGYANVLTDQRTSFDKKARTDVTKALTQTTITETNPAWSVPTATVDANLKRTTLAYDPLGRMSNVWLPGRPLTFVGNYHYDYQVRNDAVSWVGSRVVTPMGGSLTTFTLYDALLRPRQTQSNADGGIQGTPCVLRLLGWRLRWSAGCGDGRDPGERGGDLVRIVGGRMLVEAGWRAGWGLSYSS